MRKNTKIGPIDLREFLKAHGWLLDNQGRDHRQYLLNNVDYPRRQMVFPMDLSAPDYDESVDTVINKLSELMGLHQNTVLAKVRCIKDDVLRLRVFFEGDDNGLPLSYASALVNNTERLLKAGACTVLRPRLHHPRLALTEATQFVEKARFGQTEEGSFVLRVSCPINAMEVQGALDLQSDEAPFVRQVTLSVQHAISKLASAIETDTVDNLVDELKESEVPLISSNMCEALSCMHDDQIDNSLDINFDWSILRRVPVGQHTSRTIRIQSDYFSRIEEIRRELRSVELHREDTFIGTVERLDGEIGSDGRRSGVVVLALLLPDEGETIRVRTVLNVDQYYVADRAHMTNGAYILVTGRIWPGRQPRQLTEITRFELLHDTAEH